MKSKNNSLPRWNLNDLYPGMESEAFKKDFEAIVGDCKRFAKANQGKLGEYAAKKPDNLAKALKSYEKISEKLGRMASYGGLLHANDASDPIISKFYGDIHEKLTEAQSHLLFFALELNLVEEKTLNKAMKKSKELAHYKPFLDDLRLDRPYQLEDKLEKLFLEKNATTHSFVMLFNETMTALRFKIGEEALTLEPTLSMLQDENGEKRKKASDALAETFKDNLPLFTRITNTLAKDKEISDNWRGFKSVDESRHLANRVEPFVVDALVEAVRERYQSISHRYYKMKAKWMGVKQLNHWDRNAPLETNNREVPWQEAQETVLEAYNDFDPQMANIVKRFFDEKWIDVPTEAGKAGGAFSHPTVPSAHPYILLNYQFRQRDVTILAHELGHGIHQLLANEQGALMAPTPLTLAETASVFGEMLTFQKLLEKTQNENEKRILLASKVEDMINTVIRQIAFYTFERKIHEERRKGELTAQQIGEIWLGIQHESLGDAIKIGEGYETFWCYIPHFIHAPFYVYAYAFGDCLVNSLYAVYRNEQEQNGQDNFKDNYINMLKAGGSRHYSEHLKTFNLNAQDSDFWHKGLGVIENFIDQIEEISK